MGDWNCLELSSVVSESWTCSLSFGDQLEALLSEIPTRFERPFEINGVVPDEIFKDTNMLCELVYCNCRSTSLAIIPEN